MSKLKWIIFYTNGSKGSPVVI